MPERPARVEGLRAGAPLRVAGVTLLPIERVVLRSGREAHGVWVAGGVDPYALVVLDAGGARVVALDGAEVSLERLCERVPGLEASLR